MVDGINFLAAFVAAILSFALGAAWYSPRVFGNVWARESGVGTEMSKKGHRPMAYVISFLLTFIAATFLVLSLGPQPRLGFALTAALTVGIAWIATSFGSNYLFSGRSLKLFFIDAGYYVCQFLIFGIIFGVWHQY